MHQAALLDGFALDALTPQQDALPPAEMDISRGQVVQALVVAPVVILLDDCLNTGFKRAWQICPASAPMGPKWRFEVRKISGSS